MIKRIIPCLDVKNGRVVKGINFVNLVDAEIQASKQNFIVKTEQMKFVFWISQHQAKTEIFF